MPSTEAAPRPQAPPDLVDRETELLELRALAARHQPALALLYGRRRVGKTFLLDRVWEGTRVFYFLAGDTTTDWIERHPPVPADDDPARYERAWQRFNAIVGPHLAAAVLADTIRSLEARGAVNGDPDSCSA